MSTALPAVGSPLSPREVQVLRLVAAGHANARIARELGIAEDTVRSHMHRIRARLGESTRGGLVRAGFEGGWLRLPDEVVLAQASRIQRQLQRQVAA